MKTVQQLINENGKKVATNVMMVKCGCVNDSGTIEPCEIHAELSETEMIVAISNEYGIEVSTTTTKEEVTMTKLTPFQAIKAKAVELGIDIKGLRSIKAVQTAIDAHVETAATQQEEVAEPVAIELDYTASITEYATDLLELVSKGTDYVTLAKRASANAYGILGAQLLSGVELTSEQKEIMARHGASHIKREQLISFTTEEQLATMSGTQLYILGLKLGAKPQLEDIEALRANLLGYYKKNVVAQPKASAASKASEASRNQQAFTSARAIHVYPNAVKFVANNVEYTFIINKNGKGVLRQGNRSQYMQANYLKGLLYAINTKESRYLVKVLGQLRPTQPASQDGGRA